MPAADAYAAAWADLRRRRRFRRIALLAWPPLAIGTWVIVGAVAGPDVAAASFFPIAASLLLLALVVSLYPSWFACPRCREPFEAVVFVRAGKASSGANRCQNCGLPFGASSAQS